MGKAPPLLREACLVPFSNRLAQPELLVALLDQAHMFIFERQTEQKAKAQGE